MLNDEQKKAAMYTDGPCIVTAGPGTGKTTLIVHKIKHLINDCGFNPQQILALTFTDKAALEMSQRIETELKKSFSSRTFHSFALEILDEFGREILGFPSDYKIMDEVNSLVFFLENVSSFNFSSINVKNKNEDLAYELSSTISKLKDFGVSLKDMPYLEIDAGQKADILTIYAQYEKYKAQYGLIDFGDVLLYALDLLKTNEGVRKNISSRYKYILVDEFQDTNLVQLEILKLLTENDITIVGDLKQSIYSFRGANYMNLKQFKDYYKNYKEFFITRNYRSSSMVVGTINKIINKIAKKEELLETVNEVSGEVLAYECFSDKSQMAFILEKINEIKDLHSNSKSIGILCRRKNEATKICTYLEAYGIKTKKNEIDNFFSVPIIKTLLNYIKAVSSPKESNIEIYAMLKNCGLRNEVVSFISRKSSRDKKSIFETLAVEKLSEYEEENSLVHDIYDKIKNLNEVSRSLNSLRDFSFKVIKDFRFYQSAEMSGNESDVFALNSFLDFCDRFSDVYKTTSIDRFLQVCSIAKNASLRVEIAQQGFSSAVQVLTIHQAKGKEFDYVIIPFLNERRFPLSFRQPMFELSFEQNRDNFLDEELRLFFVAVSRARLCLYMTYVKRFSDNKLDSKPSSFLEILNLDVLKYDREISSLALDVKESIKTEILRKIGELVSANRFDLAKKEIDVLNSLFGKKDLNSFIIGENNSQVKRYEDMINKKSNNFDLIDFDAKAQTYSVSQLQVYESCPKKYLYQYVYKVPTVSKHYFDFGTSVHSALELLSKDFDKISEKEKLYALGISYLTSNWISKGYETHNQEEEYFAKGMEAIKSFIERESELRKSKRETIDLERKFDIELDGYKLTGFIDRIDKVGDEYEIIDYKTSNSMELSPTKLSQNMQLLVYSIALKNDFGKYPQAVSLWYLVHDKILSTKPKEENIKSTKEKIATLIGDIEKKKFGAKPGSFSCRFCDFSDICKESQTR